MKQKSIILYPNEIKWIQDSGACQIRRLVRPQPEWGKDIQWNNVNKNLWTAHDGRYLCDDGEIGEFVCPFGVAGDIFWVKETWADVNSCEGPAIAYKVDGAIRTWREFSKTFGPDYGVGPSMDYNAYPGKYVMWYTDLIDGQEGYGWRSSVHMPKWASRFELKVTKVGVWQCPVTLMYEWVMDVEVVNK